MDRHVTLDRHSAAWAPPAAPLSPSPAVAPTPTFTLLRFAVPRAAFAVVEVRGPQGAVVRVLLSGVVAAGEHTPEWDGRDDSGSGVPAGEYTVRLLIDDRVITSRRVRVG